jgi:TonB family protein
MLGCVRHTTLGLLTLVIWATALPAQTVGNLAGAVTDPSDTPIFGADVSIEGTSAHATTDEGGKFTLMDVPLGSQILSARRLGFTPARIPVEISAGANATVLIRMKVVPTTLAPVVVHPNGLEYTGRLAGYYKRLEKRSSGYFITRDQIDRQNPSNLGQLLQTVPGIRIGRGRAGITGMRMRGRTCWPLVWLDGIPMPAGETDVDAFVPSSIQGIELYLGATTAPLRYMENRDLSSCGTVLIWSRGPDTDPVRQPRSQVDLEDLLDRAAIFTADRVDTPAIPDVNHPVRPEFPPPLYAARVRGLTIAEFVVDTVGHVEEPTIGIVSSTDPLFSDAVRTALRGATFIPAEKGGRRVRQVVQQPFRFDVGQASAGSPGPEKADSTARPDRNK